MKKAAFIAVVAYFMGVIGYISLEVVRSQPLDVAGNANQFGGSLFSLGPGEAANIHIFLRVTPMASSQRPEDTCKVLVNFFDSDGNEIADATCDMQLARGAVTTCGFNPERLGERNAYLDQVKVFGPSPEACKVLLSVDVYDFATGETKAAHINADPYLGWAYFGSAAF